MKLTLSNLASGFRSANKLNENFQAIATAIENTISRDGTSPNSMSASLDMNSQRIINLPTPTDPTDAATKDYVDDSFQAAQDASQAAQDAQIAAETAQASASAAASSATASATSAAESAAAAAESAAAAAEFADTANALLPGNNLSDLADPEGALDNLSFLQAGAGAAERSVRAKLRDTVSVKDFGAVGDGVTDDTAALQAALSTTAKHVVFPDGQYRIVDALQNGTAVLTSAVADRVIEGPGAITATSVVYKALQVTGDRTRFSVSIDGNGYIGVAVVIKASDCIVDRCRFTDLYTPTGQYQSVAVYADITGLDTSVTVTNNTFRNIESVGDATSGNGVGLARAVLISASSNVTKASLVANNTIEGVIGEEGDAITLISSNGAGTYYDLPCLVVGNTVVTWTRRAVKVQCNKVTVKANTFRNTYAVNPGGMQHAVSLVQGGDHVVDGNVFVNCLFAGQVVVNASSSAERVDNITITNNVVRGLGAETSNTPIYVSSFGEGVVIAGNAILCPSFAGTNSIGAVNALSGYVGGNVVSTASATPYVFTGSANLLLDVHTTNTSTYGRRTLSTSGDALGVNVYGSSNRSLTLYNFDTTLSDAEIISRLSFHQNDADSNAILASIRAVAVGTTGSTAVTIHTGSTGTPDVERLRIGTTGVVEPGSDNAQTMGSSSKRWSSAYATNFKPGAGTATWTSGAGSPEGSVTATVGSLYTDTSGAVGSTLYVKSTGSGNTGWRAMGQPESLIIAASDESTALTAGTAKTTFRMPYAFTVTAVRASLTTAQASGSILTVDINEGGTSILSTKLTIDNTEKTSTTAATAAVISDTSLADDAEITIDIDQVGDGTAKGLKVILLGYRTS